MADTGDDRSDPPGERPDGKDSVVFGLQSQLKSLRKRVQELEREKQALRSRVSNCSLCSKSDASVRSSEMLLSSLQKNKFLADETERSGRASSSGIHINDSVKNKSERVSGVCADPDGCIRHESAEGMPGCRTRTIRHHPKGYVALKIMYFGQRFHGFASEAQIDPTIESEIFKALDKTKLLVSNKEDLHYSRCGRTDKGVSSTGQVISLYLRSKLKEPVEQIRNEKTTFKEKIDGEIDYVRVLNRVLPKDIRVIGWCPVSTDFHARFSCLGREYKYFFWLGALDVEEMRNAGKKFIGEHDFRNFCKMDAVNVNNYMRQITSFEISRCDERFDSDELWAMTIRGSAFLWHQIRCMVAVLFMVGQGLESSTVIDLLLDTSKTPRKPQYSMAPELPLVLRSCEFEDLSFTCNSDARQALYDDLKNAYQTYMLQAAIFHEALNCLSTSGESGSIFEHGKKKRGHLPLMMRPTEPSYEERRAKLDMKNKQRNSHTSQEQHK